MSKVTNITGEKEFKEKVLDSKLPVLVDFWAPWCGPCRMMAPVLESLSEKFDGKLIIAKVDTEVFENQILAYKYQIQSIPNMKLFKSGEVISDFIGFRPEEIFKNELSQFVG